MTEAPLFWLQHIENALSVVSEVPLWGSPPSFPWEKCSEQIANLLQLPDLKVEHMKTQFLTAGELTSGLGTSPVDIPVELSPLQGPVHWLMAAEEVAKLTQLALNPENGIKSFASAQFQEGFYRYLVLNCIQQIDQLQTFQDLSLKMGNPQTLPADGALCIDIGLSHPKMTLWGRLICPSSFHLAFKEHFSRNRPSLLTSPLTKKVDLTLRLELGHSALSYSQWKSVGVGDLIILDRCTYDPQSHKGTVTIVLEEAPLFRARLKENHLKIVEYAYYHEEERSMDTDHPEDEYEDEIPHEEEQEEAPPEEEGFEGSESNPDEEIHEEGDDHLWSSETAEEKDVEQIVSAQEVPLTVSVEVARLKMNLEKLLQLKPGNLVELPVRPEQGVDIVINGKKVAKGELVKLGDALGVKILQIGN